ncbi:MAG: hypothetical protein KatS3mg057_1669 [Herpetosiphonaceae bacterium]|nr:MAG: hypothetical protein KatS3mg057_1669 [Herpetosiphonaceae bacterium]
MRSPAQLTSPTTSEAWPRRWAPHEEAAVEAQVLAAFNCARSQQDLPPYQVDASLTAEAERLWMQLARQEISLKQAEAGYTLFGVIALDLSQPAQGCSIGGFDVAQVPALDRARVIGNCRLSAADQLRTALPP